MSDSVKREMTGRSTRPVAEGRGTSPATATVEDYLALLHVFERDGRPAIATRLAEQVGVALPTATATIKRMVRDGWVTVDEKKEVHLTPAGRQVARSVLRRHFLLELLLRKVLDLPWSRIHEEAHAMEHTVSEETLAQLESKLNYPATCPHGNPLPGEEQAVAHWIKLTEMASGETVIIRRIHEFAEDKADLMAFLEANNLVPGTKIVVRDVLPFNQTMTLDVAGRTVVLGMATAEWIYVEANSRRQRSGQLA
ncbi:MAG: metal-dependent transcriptional regulator [Anaerolineae bacterium]|nr:metal-dependent transcriptional regulator [Thermoflexales bacterium]MDW8407811.1 metal-dependent transcriptional regulator [Anaerolineae bacterium]